jgi:hypothetical protein
VEWQRERDYQNLAVYLWARTACEADLKTKWSTKLPQPIILKDGHTVATLFQARIFILSLTRLQSTQRKELSILITDAAMNGKNDAVLKAHNELRRVLAAEGFLQ